MLVKKHTVQQCAAIAHFERLVHGKLNVEVLETSFSYKACDRCKLYKDSFYSSDLVQIMKYPDLEVMNSIVDRKYQGTERRVELQEDADREADWALQAINQKIKEDREEWDRHEEWNKNNPEKWQSNNWKERWDRPEENAKYLGRVTEELNEKYSTAFQTGVLRFHGDKVVINRSWPCGDITIEKKVKKDWDIMKDDFQ